MSRRESTTGERPGPATRGERVLPWLLLLIGTVVFANSLQGPFIYDDAEAIVGNAQVHRLWPPGAVLLGPAQTPIAGRPVPALTFAVNYAVGGLNVTGYHVVNVGIHLLNAIILFALARRTLRGPRLASAFGASAGGLAFAISLLWLVHPLVTESVDYITQRTETLMALFYLLTIYCATRAHAESGRRWKIAAIAGCALGMASKESMVTAPLVVVLFDWTMWGRPLAALVRARWSLYAGLAATWLVLIGLNVAGPRSATVGFAAGVSSVEYLYNQCVILIDYLRLVVWPHPLVLDYGYPRPFTLGDVIPRAVVLVALGSLAVVMTARRWPAGFLLACFFIVLGPTSSVVPIASEVGAERRMYLPLTAIVALLVTTTFIVLRRAGPGVPRIGPALTAVVAIALAWGTVRRNAEYRSELTIWQSAVAAAPDNPRAHNNLANVLEDAGRLDEALDHHRRSVALRDDVIIGPNDRARGHYNLGRALQMSGAIDEAIAQYEVAVQEAPHHRAHHNLGTVLHGKGRSAEAIEHLRRAVEIEPDAIDSLYNLGFALLQAGDVDGAVPPLQRAIELNPDLPRAHFNLAGALRTRGDAAAALPHYRAAGRLAPDDVEIQAAVGYALDDLGESAEAVTHLQRAIALAPEHVGAFERLGGALFRSGRFDEGIAQMGQTIQRWPERPLAWMEATRVLAEHPDPERRNPSEAVTLGERVVLMTGGRDPNALGALAAALAAAGRRDEAVDAAARGLALAEAAQDVEASRRLRAQLTRYRTESSR